MLKNHRDKITIRELKWMNVNSLSTNSDLDYVSYHYYNR